MEGAMVKKTISKKTGPGSEQFQLRLPDGMRKQLAEVAEREGRSMNVVIVTALQMYFESERQSAAVRAQIHAAHQPGYEMDVATALKDLEDRLDRKLAELTKKTDTDEIARLIKQTIK
jgi:predicted transcriptional regulator